MPVPMSVTYSNQAARDTGRGTPPMFSIFIPAYNRAHTLPRAFDSIDAQTCRDFEVLIVDDGSADGTRELVQGWAEDRPFAVSYQWQPNQGKHIAFNTVLPMLHGELMVMLDSDDKLAPDALAVFQQHWLAIPERERQSYAGIEGLTAFFDGRVAGSRFPQDVFDADHMAIRKQFGVTGDKKNAIRSDILRRFPYPQFPGERHVRPSLLWRRIAHDYKVRFINHVVQYIEYQPGGLSANRFCLRMRNPLGYRYFFLEEINIHGVADPLGVRFNNYVNYIRYSLHGHVGVAEQVRAIHSFVLWLFALPQGGLKFLSDRLRLHRCRR